MNRINRSLLVLYCIAEKYSCNSQKRQKSSPWLFGVCGVRGVNVARENIVKKDNNIDVEYVCLWRNQLNVWVSPWRLETAQLLPVFMHIVPLPF